MESQRVKALLEGYLRGWLDFIPKTPTSRLREELIIGKILDDTQTDVLAVKIGMDAALVAGIPNKTKAVLDGLYALFDGYLALKLPSALKDDKIEAQTSATAMAEWKTLLEKMNK